jgi:transposase, IS30 family
VVKLSVEAKARIAELWAAGAPAWKIREEAGVSRHAVLRQVRRLRRRVAEEPVRSPLRLSLVEREEISRGLAAGESLRAIGRRLGRAPSTISREVSRNGGRQRYRACPAERAMGRRAKRPKPAKLATCERLRAVVEAKLEQRWSPQQIARMVTRELP